jgi:hypothetical protein
MTIIAKKESRAFTESPTSRSLRDHAFSPSACGPWGGGPDPVPL